ncbi:MAG: four helix bundle protein [Planctomycetes bacterium]|nr:four helix bundle protein [Planctomycetota bacterium]
MAAFTRFEDIQAWQKARDLARELFVTCNQPAFRRQFTIKDQLIRAGISIGANIAEGFGRKTDADFARFLDVSRGSATEIQSLLYNVLDFKLIDQARFDQLYGLARDVLALAAGLTTYLRRGKGAAGSQ